MQDELTLKELILAIQDYARYFLRKWYWFVLGALVLGGVFFWNAYKAPVNYAAPLTFMLNQEKEASVGAGAILGSLGLGGGGDGGGNTSLKLLELGKSRQVLGRVLFDSATVDGKTQLIADHLIDIYGYHQEWEESEALKGFYFGDEMPTTDDRTGNRVFKSLHNRLVSEENGLMKMTVNELSGLFDLRVKTLRPELSIVLTEGIYSQLSEYFVTASVSGKEKTLRQLRERADSVKTELGVTEARLARFQDRSSRVPLRQETVRGQELNRQVLILSTMYAEIVKNRETAAFLLASEKPAFNLIDGPLEPLRPSRESWSSALIMGGLLGGVLMGIILFFTKLVRDAMKS